MYSTPISISMEWSLKQTLITGKRGPRYIELRNFFFKRLFLISFIHDIPERLVNSEQKAIFLFKLSQ